MHLKIPIVCVACIVLAVLYLRCGKAQEVETSVILEFMTVTGRRVTYGKNDLFVYKNIPYAEPLTDASKFEPPQPLSTKINIDPNKLAPCAQLYNRPQDPNNGAILGSEDCLYLDIYSTQVPQKQNFPVFVYFHGGKFSSGHKDEYSPSYLMRQESTQTKNEENMIVVIPNYRLGILGFLSTQDEEMPGNRGLLDQQMALKWVNENIEEFGGNKSGVTIGGHGAGGVSASLHVLSEDSQDYFSAAIAGSGTAMDPWAILWNSRARAEDLSKQVSCTTASSRNMAACLRNQPLKNLLNAQRELHNLTFGPVVDGVFLSKTPKELYSQQKQRVPLLTGITENEASTEFFTEFNEASKAGNLDVMLTHLLYPYLEGTNNSDIVIKAAKYHYFRGVTAPDLMAMQSYFINLMTDYMYLGGMVQTLKSHSAINDNVWMYVFQYESLKSLGDVFGPAYDQKNRNYGISHMDDVVYLFNTTFGDWIWNNDDLNTKLISRYTKIWRTFITTRHFTAFEKWNSSATVKKYIEFTAKGEKSVENYRQTDVDFWTFLVPDIQSVNSQGGHVERQVDNDKKVSTTNWGVAGLAIMLAVLCVALAGVVIVMRKKFARKCNTSQSRDKKTTGV